MIISFLAPFFFFLGLFTNYDSAESFGDLTDTFQKEYNNLNLPDLQLSYVENINAIQSSAELNRQHKFFSGCKQEFGRINPKTLGTEQQLSYRILMLEIDLNLERIKLEKQWVECSYKTEGKGIYYESLGDEFYRYFLKRWIDPEVTPDSLFAFGLAEIDKVKNEIKDFKSNHLEMDQSSKNHQLIEDDQIMALYHAIKDSVDVNAPKLFPYIQEINTVNIEKGSNEALAIVPAFYNDGTFFYNHFDSTYDQREMGWIYLHEAVPGHHYQGQVHSDLDLGVRELFWYMGYSEGWGAYVEQFGFELGAFATAGAKHRQLNWDLIRSTRVAMDVGLNHYGWSDDKALEFWKSHIENQDQIGQREILRMKRWPAQVATYKYGRAIFDEIKAKASTSDELYNYHKQILDLGPMPLSILRSEIKNL